MKSTGTQRAGQKGLLHAELLELLAKSLRKSLTPLSLNKLTRVLQGLAAGEGVHVCSAAGLISWRGNSRPLTCAFMATEICSGRFLAWLTGPEKEVLDEVLAERGKEGLGDA